MPETKIEIQLQGREGEGKWIGGRYRPRGIRVNGLAQSVRVGAHGPFPLLSHLAMQSGLAGRVKIVEFAMPRRLPSWDDSAVGGNAEVSATGALRNWGSGLGGRSRTVASLFGVPSRAALKAPSLSTTQRVPLI